MDTLEVYSQKEPFKCECSSIAADKSISHRAAIFSLLSREVSSIKNYLEGEDTLHSLQIAQQLGAVVTTLDNKPLPPILSLSKEQQSYIKEGIEITPPLSIHEPSGILDCGNAGTAMRLYAGLLSTQKGLFVLSGDKYLNARPMKRIITPLNQIGADIIGREEGNYAPLCIVGSKELRSFHYQSPIASAQVKSALILSALFAKGVSTYEEPELSRNHTEKMLLGMGANLEIEGLKITIHPLELPLKPLHLTIPADPSSAFFFALAAAIVPKSRVLLKNVLLNPTRIEAFRVLEKMGARISYYPSSEDYESVGDIEVEGASELVGVSLEGNIPSLIDEIPALSIAMACANGESRVRGAEELRVKESDRIQAVITNLTKCGVECEEFKDGFLIKGIGQGSFKSATLDSFGDHRIAMSFAIAALRAEEKLRISDYQSLAISFPNFLDILQKITQIREINGG